MSLPEEGENKPTEAKLQGYAAVLSIGSTRCKANMLGMFFFGGFFFLLVFFLLFFVHLNKCLPHCFIDLIPNSFRSKCDAESAFSRSDTV